MSGISKAERARRKRQRQYAKRARQMKWHRIHPREIREEVKADGLLNIAVFGGVVAFETPKRLVLMHRDWLYAR